MSSPSNPDFDRSENRSHSRIQENPSSDPESREQSPTTVDLSTTGSPVETDPDKVRTTELPRRFGDYELLEVLGRGGMGVVYKARQISLDRLVAIKMILPSYLDSEQAIQRFQTEAKAAAGLEHEGIVPVYDSGEVDGCYYFSMKLVEGGSLQQAMVDGPLPEAVAVEMVRKVGAAVHHAHLRGIIHRDLKPANVLLEEDLSHTEAGEAAGGATAAYEPQILHAVRSNAITPKLADFGLAKLVSAEGLSVTGVAMGTPAYMPPEQVKGDLQQIGPVSDVYSLGALLYALLSGRPPFQAANAFETMRLVREQEAIPLRRLNPHVAKDLETVCMKCLDKDPRRRYFSAQELVEELTRFSEGKGVKARPVGAIGRSVRWCRRNPVVAGLLTLVVMALIAGSTVSTVLAIEASREAERANGEEKKARFEAGEAERARKLAASREEQERKQRIRAETAEGRAEEKAAKELKERKRNESLVYAAQLKMAQEHWKEKNKRQAWEALSRADWRMRHWEHDYLFSRFLSDEGTGRSVNFPDHPQPVTQVTVSPNGQTLATACGDPHIRIWNLSTGKLKQILRGHERWVSGLAFTPNGRHLISGSTDRTIKVWNLHSGMVEQTLRGHRGSVTGIALSPNGKHIASCSTDGTVRVWERATGFSEVLTGHRAMVRRVAFAPDGQQLASASDDKTIRIWDWSNGKAIRSLAEHTRAVTGVAYASQGLLVSGSHDGTVRLWNVASGKFVHTFTMPNEGRTNGITFLTVTPDGQRVLAASEDNTIRMWELSTKERRAQPKTFRGHSDVAIGLSCAPNGSFFVSGGMDHAVKLWSLTTDSAYWTSGSRGGMGSVAFSPDGSLFATGGDDMVLRIRGSLSRQVIRELRGYRGNITSIAFDPTGQWLATGSVDRRVRVWDVGSGALKQSWTFSGDFPPFSLSIAPNGKQIAVASGGKVLIVEPGQDKPVRELDVMKGMIFSVAFSPNGKQLAVGGADAIVSLWEPCTGKKLRALEGHGMGVLCAQFGPNGKEILSGGVDNKIRIWDAMTGKELLLLEGHRGPVNYAVWSTDGKRILSGSEDATIRVWSRETGQQLLQIEPEAGAVTSLALSPNGRTLLSASRGTGVDNPSTVQWHHAERSQEVHSLTPTTFQLKQTGFDSTGEQVIAIDKDGRKFVWSVETGYPVQSPQATISPERKVSRDGTYRLVTSGVTIDLVPVQKESDALARQIQQLSRVPQWLEGRIAEAEKKKEWSAVALLTGQLLEQQPWRASCSARRAYAFLQMKRSDRALQQYAQMLLFNPKAHLWPLDPKARLRGHVAARSDKWHEAVDAFESALRQPDAIPNTWIDLLRASTAIDDLEAFRRVCDRALSRFDNLDDPVERDILYSCIVGPCSHSQGKRLAELFGQLMTKKKEPWALRIWGMALYRAGNYTAAVQALESARKAQGRLSSVDGYLFLAMAWHRVGQPQLAKQYLGAVEKWLNRQTKWTSWKKELRWELWKKEATELLAKAIMPPAR